jgi:hypothetical protein
MPTSSQDYIDVLNIVHKHFQYSDTKDFASARSLWADELTVDLGGINPDVEGTVRADALAQGWERLIGSMELTQHMLTSHTVTVLGDDADVAFHLQALHYHPALGEGEDVNTWTLYGRGEFHLQRTTGIWKITSTRLASVHNTGNANMLADIRSGKTQK